MAEDTKKALSITLKKLMEKKKLNKITVKEITSECGINRLTFYYHFKDIYDLLNWTFRNDIAEELKNVPSDASWSVSLEKWLLYCKKNRKFYFNISSSFERRELENTLSAQIIKLSLPFIERQVKGTHIPEEIKAYINKLYSYIIVGVILDWIENEMEESPVLVANYLENALQGTCKNALRRLYNAQKQPVPSSQKKEK